MRATRMPDAVGALSKCVSPNLASPRRRSATVTCNGGSDAGATPLNASGAVVGAAAEEIDAVLFGEVGAAAPGCAAAFGAGLSGQYRRCSCALMPRWARLFAGKS